MEIGEIVGYVITALSAGGITQIINWRINKRKAKAEAKQSEIEVIAQTVQTVYEPIIKHQNERITELEREVKELRDEKRSLQTEYESKIDSLKEEYSTQIQSLKDILLNFNSSGKKYNRGANGQFVKAVLDQD